MMSETELLLWVRGPALQIATLIFLLGVIVRIVEILMLGRKKDLSVARGSAVAGGLRTIITRSIPDRGTLQRSTFNVVAGYVFHIGFFVVLLFFAPHILVFRDAFGISWPSLPTPVIDATTIVTIIALLAVLAHRLWHPVMRFLSRFQDYLVWLLTILPLITGYFAFHRIEVASPATLIAVHILSVELLMVLFPFTKLMHAFTLFIARYYNGAISGRRGVNS
jgi:nitrate reductase gamma subunit